MHLWIIILQHRWSRGRSKERGYHGHGHHHNIDGEVHDSEGTDYAADNSSDHSSSATHSPRHKPVLYGDSPLARTHLAKLDKQDSLSSQHEPTNVDAVRSSISAAQVHKHAFLLLYDTIFFSFQSDIFINIIFKIFHFHCMHKIWFTFYFYHFSSFNIFYFCLYN